MLNTDLEIGGTPTVVRELAVRMKRWEGVEVEVACLGKWGAMADRIRDAGVGVTALGAGGVWDLGVVRRLAGLIRERGIDTVFSFLVHANAAAAVSSWGNRGVRYVQAIQTTQRWPRWHWWVQGLVERAAERIVVPSESVAKAAVEWAGIARERIVVIPNAVEVGEFEGVGREYGDGGAFPVGFVGRLDRVKRVGDLLEAVGRLGGLVHLHVFGDGAERGAIEAKIGRLAIGRWVTMHGQVGRPQEALGRVGLLVLASEAEGFPMVLIEAMAAGVAIVGTDAPGIRDVVSDGRTGVLVPVGDVVRLAEAMKKVVGDGQMRRGLVARAGVEVRGRYSWERVLGEYRRVLGI